jgi:hypothetical protein
MQLFYLKELKNLRNVLQSSGTHISHSLGLFDAFFNRHEISLVVVVCHHGILHSLQVFLDLILTLAKRLKQENFLFG